VRIVHYVNQYFGGVGGEEANDHPVEVRQGAVGPGRAFGQVLGEQAEVVATILAGDNRFVEEPEASLGAVRAALREWRPDVVVAGPAFDAGRYGLACALVCRAAAGVGVPALTAMHPENAGVLAHRRELVCVPTGANPAEMVAVLRRSRRWR
jgi:glycine reductase